MHDDEVIRIIRRRLSDVGSELRMAPGAAWPQIVAAMTEVGKELSRNHPQAAGEAPPPPASALQAAIAAAEATRELVLEFRPATTGSSENWTGISKALGKLKKARK